MKELFEVERCRNCKKLKGEHRDNILRTNPSATFCPRSGMWEYQQMTPLELGEWIEEQYENK